MNIQYLCIIIFGLQNASAASTISMAKTVYWVRTTSGNITIAIDHIADTTTTTICTTLCSVRRTKCSESSSVSNHRSTICFSVRIRNVCAGFFTFNLNNHVISTNRRSIFSDQQRPSTRTSPIATAVQHNSAEPLQHVCRWHFRWRVFLFRSLQLIVVSWHWRNGWRRRETNIHLNHICQRQKNHDEKVWIFTVTLSLFEPYLCIVFSSQSLRERQGDSDGIREWRTQIKDCKRCGPKFNLQLNYTFKNHPNLLTTEYKDNCRIIFLVLLY